MEQPPQTQPISKPVLWTGRVITTLMILFMAMDAVMKLIQPDPVLKGTMKLGFDQHAIPVMGVLLSLFTILYAIPQTSALGAICLTGYLGGAFACQLRINSPLFDMLFPVIFGALIWLGLLLRDRRLQQLIPLRR